MKRKCLTVGIVLLILGTCIIPTIAQDAQKPQSTSRGSWLYVGGSGPGNYTKIQDAVDNASDGDTVFVFHNSSPYHENLLVEKRLSIQGENRNSTMVIVDNSRIAVNITSNRVNISEFTFLSKNNLNIFILNDFSVIRNNTFENISLRSFSGEKNNPISHDHIEVAYNILQYRCQDFPNAIWLIKANYSAIEGNDITGNTYAILVSDASYSLVSSNYIHDCFGGISLVVGGFNRIVDNRIVNVHGTGIECSSSLTVITGNSVINATFIGIELSIVILTTMYRNKIQNCPVGLSFYTSLFNRIIENDFLNNTNDTETYMVFRTHWRGNYWGRAHIGPKVIVCNIVSFGYEPSILLTYYNFDWFPALKPHDIGE